MPRSRHTLIAGVAVLAAAAPLGGHAAAAPLVHEHYSGDNSFIWEDYCHVEGRSEITIRYDEHFEGNFLLNSRGPDGLEYGVDNLRFTAVRTNLANGKTFTTESREGHHDAEMIDNGDGTSTLQSAASNSVRTYDNAGRLVDREASRAVWEILIDNNGTPTDPSDDEFLEFLGFAKEPVGYISDVDFCNAAHDSLE